MRDIYTDSTESNRHFILLVQKIAVFHVWFCFFLYMKTMKPCEH